MNPDEMVKVIFGEAIEFREKERLAKNDLRINKSERTKLAKK